MATAKSLPRGLRLNNPGNLVRTPVKWQGQSAVQKDSRFVTFDEPKWGIRALAKTLMTYQDKHKLNTCQKIISRWAPPHENNTKSYVNTLCKQLGVAPNEAIDVASHPVAVKLVKAITLHENGVQPYSDAQINAGLRLAGIIEEKPVTLLQSRTIQGSAVAATGGFAAVLITLLESFQEVVPLLGDLKSLSPVALGIVGVLSLAGALYAAYARWDDKRNGVK